VAILRWNRSTAGTAGPICALAAARRGAVPAARASPARPTHAAQGRGRAARAEAEAARRDLPGAEEAEERDLRRRRRAEAALYMEAASP